MASQQQQYYQNPYPPQQQQNPYQNSQQVNGYGPPAARPMAPPTASYQQSQLPPPQSSFPAATSPTNGSYPTAYQAPARPSYPPQPQSAPAPPPQQHSPQYQQPASPMNYDQQPASPMNYDQQPGSPMQYDQQPAQPQMLPQQTAPMASRYPPGPPGAPRQAMPPPPQHHQQPPGGGWGQPPPHHQPAAGQYPQQPQYGGYPQHQPVQQQQRLDPDAMPSVIQVLEDDILKHQSSNQYIYQTAIPATVPPLITTMGFEGSGLAADAGTAVPNFLRCSVYQVPQTEDILKASGIPLSITVKPFEEQEIDRYMQVPLSEGEIVRCNRCKAYMNPYMRFIDGGRRFQCALCRGLTEVPQNYFAHLDHIGQRLDKYDRPELYLGTYEFKATQEFCRNQTQNCRQPHIVFAFELTVNSKPILAKLAAELPGILEEALPRDVMRPGSRPPLVGFMTYNSKIQMYDILNGGKAHVICDVSSPFPPITQFLCCPQKNKQEIASFLQKLPDLYPEGELETETILGPVIEAAMQTCQVDIGNWYQVKPELSAGQAPAAPGDPAVSVAVGKVYLFHCTLPTFGQDGVTPGRLKPRWTSAPEEARRLLGTDKEKQILSPEPSKYYSTLAQKCVTDYGSGVELFLFPPVNGSFLDLASLSELVRITGSGGIHKYYNEASTRFLEDLKFSLQYEWAFDTIMKVRTSIGIRPFEHVGNYYARTTSDIELASMRAGASVAVELRYDDKLEPDDTVIIQVAVLYTAISGERRVRLHNTSLAVCQQVADVYRNACCDTLLNLMLRQSIAQLRLGEKTVQQIKEAIITRSVTILAAYRKHCAQPGSSLGQLILPEALKLLPVYVTGAIKCDAIDGGPEMLPDDKAFAQIRALSSWLDLSQVTLYPKLLRLEYTQGSEEEQTLQAVHVRCSGIRLSQQDGVCYVLENGFYLFLYLPAQPGIREQGRFFRNVFGTEAVQNIHPEAGLPQLLNEDSEFVQKLVKRIYRERKRTLKVYIVRQGIDKIENVFRSFLYEDKKTHASGVMGDSKHEAPSYVDLLCHLHKEIRAQLN